MTPQQLRAAARRRTADLFRSFGEDARRLREDAGVSQRALSRFTGIDQAGWSRVEAGTARPTLETCVAIAAGLGSDLSVRLFPNTGPPIHDRHQAPIVESLVASLDRRWRAWPEVGVRHPVRGWIDLVIADPAASQIAAIEVVSSIQRFEQLLRWSGAKAEALPSAQHWPFGTTAPEISRVLVVRATRANEALVAAFRATVEAAHPGDPWQAMQSLTGNAPWPGSVLLWATERKGARVEIVAAPGRRRTHQIDAKRAEGRVACGPVRLSRTEDRQ